LFPPAKSESSAAYRRILFAARFFFLNGKFAEQHEKKQQREKTDPDKQNLQAEHCGRFADNQFPKDLPKKKRVEIFPRNFVIFSSVFHKFH